MLVELPGEPRTRLDFEPGVAVALELGAEGEFHVLAEAYGVLREHVDEVQRVVGRNEGEDAAAAGMVAVRSPPATPHDLVLAAPAEVVLQIDIDGVDVEREQPRLLAVVAIEVDLRLQARTVAELAAPARQQVRTRDRSIGEARALRLAVVRIAEQRDAAAVLAPIGAKAGLLQVPCVGHCVTVGRNAVVVAKALGVKTRAGVFAEAAAVAQCDAALLGPGIRARQRAQRVVGRARDDVDDAVDRVRAPQRAARAAHNLDAIDVLEHHVLHVPKHAGVQWRVDAAPVDQHQQLVGAAAVEAARRDRVAVGAGASNLQVGREAQGFGQARDARAANLVACDHVDRGRRISEALGPLRHRRDLDLGELFDRQMRQARARTRAAVDIGSAGAALQRQPQQAHCQSRDSCHCCPLLIVVICCGPYPAGVTSSSTVKAASVNSLIASSTITRCDVIPLRYSARMPVKVGSEACKSASGTHAAPTMLSARMPNATSRCCRTITLFRSLSPESVNSKNFLRSITVRMRPCALMMPDTWRGVQGTPVRSFRGWTSRTHAAANA